MTFPYLKVPNLSDPNAPWTSRPIIPVRLLRGEVHQDVYALVDSGADKTLFDASLADLLGLDLDAAKRERFVGISGTPIEVAVATIEVQVRGSDDRFELEAGFTTAQGVSALLGQAGFFERHKVTFERAKERLTLKPIY